MKVIKKVFNSEIKTIDEKEMTLTAYVSTGARDRMNESLDPAGADLTNYKKNPVVLWAHDYSAPPIGKALWVKKDKGGVLSKVKFASTAFAQEIFQLYKEGFLKAFSVGFVPTKTEDGDGDKEPRRTFRKWELLEYSAVPVPANPEALTLAVQKGVLRTDAIKKSIEDAAGGEDQAEDESQEENENDDNNDNHDLNSGDSAEGDDAGEKNPPVEETGLEEILEENKELREIIAALGEEIKDLRYEIYAEKNKKQQELPGITVDALAEKVVEVVNGVVRKAQGKID